MRPEFLVNEVCVICELCRGVKQIKALRAGVRGSGRGELATLGGGASRKKEASAEGDSPKTPMKQERRK